nr:SDR family NAD(P)-dependent oxidoreductase [Chitinophagales bacterium]
CYDSIDDFERILRINVMANIVPTGVCLSDLVRNKGFVITISSVAGFAPLYGRTSYCASKFALHGFFETLRTEHLGVLDIMLVCPTFVDTAFGNSENKKEISKKLTPNEVANGIYNAYLKKVKFLSLGKNSKLARLIYKFFPKFYIKKMMEQNQF